MPTRSRSIGGVCRGFQGGIAAAIARVVESSVAGNIRPRSRVMQEWRGLRLGWRLGGRLAVGHGAWIKYQFVCKQGRSCQVLWNDAMLKGNAIHEDKR
jgi:hypothetical protein